MHSKINLKICETLSYLDEMIIQKTTLRCCPVANSVDSSTYMNIKYVQIDQIRHVRNINEEIYKYLLIFCALHHRVCGVEKLKIKLRLGKLLTYFYKQIFATKS